MRRASEFILERKMAVEARDTRSSEPGRRRKKQQERVLRSRQGGKLQGIHVRYVVSWPGHNGEKMTRAEQMCVFEAANVQRQQGSWKLFRDAGETVLVGEAASSQAARPSTE